MQLKFKRKPINLGDSYAVTIPKDYFNEGLLNPEEELEFTVEAKEQ